MKIESKIKFYEAQLETLERDQLLYQTTIDFYEEVEKQGLTPEDKKGEREKAEAQLKLTDIKAGVVRTELTRLRRRAPAPKTNWRFWKRSK